MKRLIVMIAILMPSICLAGQGYAPGPGVKSYGSVVTNRALENESERFIEDGTTHRTLESSYLSRLNTEDSYAILIEDGFNLRIESDS